MSVNATATVHATAVVEPGCTIGPGCIVGPYCVLGPDVVLADNVELKSHVAVAGITRIGAGTVVYPFASLGHAPQDLKYRGERTELVIGANNRIREYVTMNPGTEGGGGITKVGDDCLFMGSVHVGHDCHVGNNVIIANSVALAGHVIVEDNVVIGGLSGVQQFCRIGRGAMIGGMSGIVGDVIPYGTTTGERAHLAGLNFIGLKRRNTDRGEMNELRTAFGSEVFEGEGPFAERVERALAAHPENPFLQEISAFVTAEGAKRFTVPE
ncbi:acyl-ACP--UDP-N-acetylglucosamine O-acyltransferase [Algicella marina]|uniref:Acyl-ACP--UDP-N-acetylglucosamine O-acyltransferase n=1 Tax=Algicella marina TaxID=2683284 RepID=A0A6P1T0A7_9RHOB|nr:acyl-ACP--UDP-N-acetylglucosamine O-acyltransferase [Algicella marina]QHQ34719.1 acyl-ACP--UDP-N-acetylglucosamine O-acyltransferase [Algicella marina]